MTQLSEDLHKLKRLKGEEATLKDAYETRKHERKFYEVKCIERMEAEQTESLRTDGTLFIPVETTYASVQDRQAFIEWARENDEGLVEPKERKDVLNQLVRERLDNGEELPPGVGFYNRPYISQRVA